MTSGDGSKNRDGSENRDEAMDHEAVNPGAAHPGPERAFEDRVRDALQDLSIRADSSTAGVMAAVGGRSPAELARERLEKTLRSACGVAAGFLLMLSTVAALLPASESEQGGEAWNDAMALEATTGTYFEEYSDESAVLAALFAEETLQ